MFIQSNPSIQPTDDYACQERKWKIGSESLIDAGFDSLRHSLFRAFDTFKFLSRAFARRSFVVEFLMWFVIFK